MNSKLEPLPEGGREFWRHVPIIDGSDKAEPKGPEPDSRNEELARDLMEQWKPRFTFGAAPSTTAHLEESWRPKLEPTSTLPPIRITTPPTSQEEWYAHFDDMWRFLEPAQSSCTFIERMAMLNNMFGSGFLSKHPGIKCTSLPHFMRWKSVHEMNDRARIVGINLKKALGVPIDEGMDNVEVGKIWMEDQDALHIGINGELSYGNRTMPVPPPSIEPDRMGNYDEYLKSSSEVPVSKPYRGPWPDQPTSKELREFGIRDSSDAESEDDKEEEIKVAMPIAAGIMGLNNWNEMLLLDDGDGKYSDDDDDEPMEMPVHEPKFFTEVGGKARTLAEIQNERYFQKSQIN